MPLKKVIADFGRGVFSPLSGKKGNHKNNVFSYYQNCNRSTLPSRHIYYEPPEEFDWDATSSLLPELNTSCVGGGEVVVHKTTPSPPESKSEGIDGSRKDSGLPRSDTNASSDNNSVKEEEEEPTRRAYTKEEFTSAILARTGGADVANELTTDGKPVDDMGDSGVLSNGQQLPPDLNPEDCDCERRCSNPKHGADCLKNSEGSPVLERRNKSVLGRLRNFASRSSYSPSEDGHSHSSDYEEPEDEKHFHKPEHRFSRDARERSSSSWAGRVRDLHRDVKKKISRFRNSRGTNPEDEMGEGAENSDVVMHPGSSVESIPSGSGSSLQPPTPTSSNRSSTTSAGEEEHGTYVGTFIGRARALVDCTPSPYDRDGLAFKKGDVIDIIAKHKTGLWVGMAQGKVGHFKFINVQEFAEQKRKRRSKGRNKGADDQPACDIPRRPDTLEEILALLGLQEYTNVLVLNGYDELDTFREIEKADLDGLGIQDPDHAAKLLAAAERMHDALDEEDDDLEEEAEDDLEAEDESRQMIAKQSPRDSGCYASHENLEHQGNELQQPTNHEQFAIGLEDATATPPETRCATTTVLNNLDGSDDVANDAANDLANYNIILPEPDSDPREEKVGDSTDIAGLDPDGGNSGVGIQYLLYSGTGPKSSPGSPRKTRNKHHHSRNKSHSHRSKDLFNELNCGGFDRYRQADHQSGAFVYSWSAFARGGADEKKQQQQRRNIFLCDHDDALSDPAEDASSPGSRQVAYNRRAKQRKGSLQTLIHDTRPPSPTLVSKVNKKLVAEKIYLHEEPYTDKTGFCGIPPALVQRYAEELQHSVVDVADALDQIRITCLQQQARRGVPNDFLSDSCIVPVVEPNYSSLKSWLTSLGLPMYESNFASQGMRELHHLAASPPLTADEIAHLGVRDPYHQVYLESAIAVLYVRFRRRPQTYAQGQSLS